MTTTSSSQALKSWAQFQITSLYEFIPEDPTKDFQALFERLFSKKTKIVINDAPISLEAFKNDVESRGAVSRALVSWDEIEQHTTEGEVTVTGRFVVNRSLKFRIRAAPAQSKMAVVFSMSIDRGPNVQNENEWRIVQLTQTQTDEPVKLELHRPNNNDS